MTQPLPAGAGSGFSNPLVGGGGGLVYPSIHSPDFVQSISGWTINKDGSAEFNDLTIRGTFQGLDFLINASGFFFYKGSPASGNLFMAWAESSGTDSFGNTYDEGFGYYSTTTGNPLIEIRPDLQALLVYATS